LTFALFDAEHARHVKVTLEIEMDDVAGMPVATLKFVEPPAFKEALAKKWIGPAGGPGTVARFPFRTLSGVPSGPTISTVLGLGAALAAPIDVGTTANTTPKATIKASTTPADRLERFPPMSV
jgi:hypothetical protein